MKKILDKEEKLEILDLYDETYTSIRYLAKLFNVGETGIKWLVNYKNYREKQTIANKKWREKNIKRVREMNRRAAKKYQKRHGLYYSANPQAKLNRIIKFLRKKDGTFKKTNRNNAL